MLSLKRAFDPKELLNPGKVIPTCTGVRCTSLAGCFPLRF
jgi:hypothetical protein